MLHSIFNYFNIVSYLDDTNWDLYIIFFYIGIVLVAIMVIDALYVSYAFSRKRYSFTWPIIILRYMGTLFMTVLYLPFLDYFMSVPACVEDKNTGLTVHSYYSEQRCWNGVHILHAIFAIFGSIMFVTVTAVLSLTYFEYKGVSNDPNAR